MTSSALLQANRQKRNQSVYTAVVAGGGTIMAFIVYHDDITHSRPSGPAVWLGRLAAMAMLPIVLVMMAVRQDLFDPDLD